MVADCLWVLWCLCLHQLTFLLTHTHNCLLYLSGKSWVSCPWIIRLTLSGLCHVTHPVDLQESYGVCRTSVSSACGFTFLTASEGQNEAPCVLFLEIACIDVIRRQLDSIAALLPYSNAVFINGELVALHVFQTTMSQFIMPVIIQNICWFWVLWVIRK